MQAAKAATGTHVAPSSHDLPILVYIAAVVCLVWYSTVALVCSIGVVQIWRHYSSPRPPAELEPSNAPDVTIIRPIKGLEPRLYDCLASTFRQDYNKNKLHFRFCISNRDDPAYPVIQKLLSDFPGFDAKLLVEAEDEALRNGDLKLGPNPKIRNMSRAYREAIGDVVWIIDCNIWVAKDVCARMVAKLQGRGSKHKFKFVHQLPLTVDVGGAQVSDESESLLNGTLDGSSQIRTTNSASHATMADDAERSATSIGGGRLDETFMASAHGKFYTAINTVQIAPCIMGKSTMFWRSHLNSLTNDAGINHFSENICEDHLIGDLLWKNQVPEERQGNQLGKHAMCFGDLAIQPIANMSLREYWSRRVRWLRVRKFTVTLATLVEPGTESFLCSLYGAFAVTTLPFFHENFGIPQTWFALALFWLLSVSIWCFMDRLLYLKLHSGAPIAKDEDTPSFVPGKNFRPLSEWLPAWLGRESLALPIWIWAIYGGAQVEWRGRKFWVGMDMRVHEVTMESEDAQRNGVIQESPKTRRD